MWIDVTRKVKGCAKKESRTHNGIELLNKPATRVRFKLFTR